VLPYDSAWDMFVVGWVEACVVFQWV
jgi:hypothetical protein